MRYKEAKRKLDDVFARYIRTRDREKPCISCGKHSDFKEAGHYYKRDILSLRWNEMNVNGQCIECNRNLDGNPEGYKNGLVARYGFDTIGYLDRESARQMKYYTVELEQMIDLYEEKSKKICKSM